MGDPFSRILTEVSAEALNRSCQCVTLDRPGLAEAIARQGGDVAVAESMFSDVPVFVPAAAVARMLATVTAIEAASRAPRFVERVMARSPAIARMDHGPRGVFMGYDFHIVDGVPRLIEVNTNAGGAALNALLAEAQRACCPEVDEQLAPGAVDFDRTVLDMFLAEWSRQRGPGGPARVAIVDDAPDAQFLYPEFLLIQGLLARGGIDTVIVDPAELDYDGVALSTGGQQIDMVYNRLVDFMLVEERHGALRAAYEAGAVVVTPNPHLHALLADKRNLVLLSNSAFVDGLDLAAAHREALATIPRTIDVEPGLAQNLWATRRDWFFKPVSGHGGKAVYSGAKLTRSTFAAIIKGGYVAQAHARPGARVIRRAGEDVTCKADIRLYTYDGRLLLLGSRLYQGQTTNFRTPGGGFAPVYVV